MKRDLTLSLASKPLKYLSHQEGRKQSSADTLDGHATKPQVWRPHRSHEKLVSMLDKIKTISPAPKFSSWRPVSSVLINKAPSPHAIEKIRQPRRLVRRLSLGLA